MAKTIFEKALKDAQRLSTGHYVVEVDNLECKTVASVLFKVLHELDMTEEEPYTYLSAKYDGDGTMSQKQLGKYKEKLRGFIRKYREYCEEDQDKKMYESI